MNTKCEPLRLANGQFKDEHGRIVTLRGINFAADVKSPAPGTNRYINTPCTLEEADEHFSRIQAIGFNCLRFLFTWDALQPDHPDKYDDEYIEFAISLIRKAINDYGFYVFMDPHQDIWSRFSGGSGAPLWTLHAAGFDPEYFEETHAAMLWDPNAKGAIKMQWASNYHRLVCQTMFTLFFAGPEFAPKAEINGQNIGTYLKDKFFAALRHFMTKVNEADLGPRLLGWESMNEPGHGLIGYGHLDTFPQSRTHVKLGTAPTPFQAMLLGNGKEQSVETFKFTSLGLKRIEESFKVSPKCGTWLNSKKLADIDENYGWSRSWKGGCIWELHGVYDSQTKQLLRPDYFEDVNSTVRQWKWLHGDSSSKGSSDSRDISADERSIVENSDLGSSRNSLRGSNSAKDVRRPSATASSSEIEEANAEDSIKRSAMSSYMFENDTRDMHVFVDKFFVKHWMEFSQLVSEVNPNWFQFMQAPVNTPPPHMERLYPGSLDPSRVVYTPHFYDGLTLMLKRWRWLNVDAIGVMREHYGNPIPALRFGDSRICQSFADQFRFLKEEGRERLGKDVAFLMSEIGIPYDMDKKDAYTSGYWDNQIRAMDANLSALEQANINYTLWCYTVNNTHAMGDAFAGEDLSIFSRDDKATELKNEPENGIRAPQSVIRPTPLRLAGEIVYTNFNIRKCQYTLTIIPRVNAPSEVFAPKYHFHRLRALTTANVTTGSLEIRDEVLIWNHGESLGQEQTLVIRGDPKFRDSVYSYFESAHKTLQVIGRQFKFASARSKPGHYPKTMDEN